MAKKEIQVDEDTGDTIGTQNDARLAMYNKIADSTDTGRASDFMNINDDDTLEKFEAPIGDEDAPIGDEDAPIEEVAPAEEEEVVAAPTKYRIKVNGREMDLTMEELIARAQKVESADQYIAEARAAAKKEAAPPQQSQEEIARLQAEDDLALARAIQMGSEEEAVAAIRKIKTSGPSINPDDLTRTIDERLNFQEAINWFNTEYEEIKSDPILDRMAIDMDAQQRAAGDSRSYTERYKEIGENIRNWLKSKTPEAPVVDAIPPVDTRGTKETRKASTPATPKPASAKVQKVEEEEKEESAADIIRSMAQSRGGPQWMNSGGRIS